MSGKQVTMHKKNPTAMEYMDVPIGMNDMNDMEESRSVLSKVDWSGKLRQMELKDVLDIDLASMRRSVGEDGESHLNSGRGRFKDAMFTADEVVPDNDSEIEASISRYL